MNTYTDIVSALEISVATFFRSIAAYLPQVIGAIILVLVGWLLARLIRSLILKIGATLDRTYRALQERAGVAEIGTKLSVSAIVAGTAYWLVMLIFLTAAASALGLPGLHALLDRFIVYFPNLVVAVVILFVGYLLSGLAQDLVSRSVSTLDEQQTASLAVMARVVVLVLALLLAARQMGIDIHLLIYLIVVAAAALFGGMGLAFGLGAATTLRNIIAIQNVKRNYAVGQRVRVNGVEGEILAITRTAVLLDSNEGRALMPANAFNEHVSILMQNEDA